MQISKILCKIKKPTNIPTICKWCEGVGLGSISCQVQKIERGGCLDSVKEFANLSEINLQDLELENLILLPKNAK